MTETVTISFVGTTEIRSWLRRWANEDDRSISYILRQILQQEAQRRAQFQSAKQVVNQQSHQTGDAAAGSDYAPPNIIDSEGFHNV